MAISLGPVDVHWYGLMYVLAFIVGWWGTRVRSKQPGSPVATARVEDLVFYFALGVFLGGRVGYMLFYNFGGFIEDPISIIYVWRGGMSYHGGMIGVLIAFAIFARRTGQTFFAVADFVAPWVPPGLGFGRLGNFINGELWGKETAADAPWAVIYEGVPRHASQLYEAALEGLLLFLILFFFSAKPRPRMAVSGLFLLGYGVFRTGIEFIRVPDDGIYFAWGWLTKGQALSAPMILVGLAFLIWAYRGNGKRVSATA